MYIKRDFLDTLSKTTSLEVVLLWGPRQVGKTTLLDQLNPKSSLFLEDLGWRQAAENDPALVVSNLATPCLIDEAQYAPNLFPELKLRIDKLRRENLKTTKKRSTLYYLTGEFGRVKMKKLYFFDVGLCARLQGHQDETSIWNSPQIGSLFETMVFSEIIKTRDNFIKDWNVFTWRTKDQNEIDFIIQEGNRFLFIESKLGIHGVKSFDLDGEAKKVFQLPYQKIVVSIAPTPTQLNADTISMPINLLGEYLASW